MNNTVLNTISALALVFLLTACGGKSFKKNPMDEIIRDLPPDQVFSLLLHDMDVQGNFTETYYHKYRVVADKGEGDIDDWTTGWLEVPERVFNQHINDMGMELAARDSTGKLTKGAAPPGYNNYVGNPKYGHWENRGGSSFWAFYGQYAFMSSMFNLLAYPARRSYYDTYRGSYYGTGRSYYGPSTGGSSYYGTNSRYNRSNTNSNWSRKSSTFANRVNSRTQRSSSSSSGGFRSRGGSFGK